MHNTSARLLVGLLASCCCLSAVAQTPQVVFPTNVHVDVSAVLVSAAAHQDIERSEPVDELIKGVALRGTAYVSGTSGIELTPDPRRAALTLVVSGRIFTRVVGDADAFNIHTDSISPYEIRKRLTVEATGITGWPAAASVLTATYLRGFSSEFPDPIPLALREVAMQEFNEDKHTNDTLASWRIQRDMRDRFDRESTPQLIKAGEQFRRGYTLAHEHGIALDHLHFSTTRTTLSAQARLGSEPSVAKSPPPVPANADFTLRVHESAINHVLQQKLGGKTFTEKELKANINAAFDAIGVKTDLKPAPIAVTLHFAAREPLTVRFDDDAVIVTIHIEKFSLPTDSITGAKVQTRFGFEKTSKGMALLRRGRVQMLTSSGQFIQDELLRAGFEQLLFQRLDVTRIPVPIGNVGGLVPTEAGAKNGWLLTSWRK